MWLLQRKATKVGEGLAKTTGWIRRTLLKKRGVTMLGGVEYVQHRRRGPARHASTASRACSTSTRSSICAGQEPRRELAAALARAGMPYTLIGGADVAAELDAKRAIEQGTRVAMAL